MSGNSGSNDGDEAVLDRAIHELIEAWAMTADGWRDQARTDFGREFLDPIEWRTRHALRSLSDLSMLCAEAQRRCT